MVRYLYINICIIDIYLVSTTFIDISNKNQHGNITNVISLTMPLWPPNSPRIAPRSPGASPPPTA